ncbi:MAG TPA: hypothetical protein VLQ45_30060, partial [Thermoanaerobaculia bacterium]|nr:hypothetical protein [Thermoanaerobaculia bacterium]
EAVPETHLEGFAIETGLNWACRELGQRITTTVMHNLKHLVKEKKRGLVEGSRARYKMFAAVFKAWVSLKLDRPDLRRAPDHPHPLFKPELEYINF